MKPVCHNNQYQTMKRKPSCDMPHTLLFDSIHGSRLFRGGGALALHPCPNSVAPCPANLSSIMLTKEEALAADTELELAVSVEGVFVGQLGQSRTTVVSVGLFRRRGNAVAQNPRRRESRRVRADGIGGAEERVRLRSHRIFQNRRNGRPWRTPVRRIQPRHFPRVSFLRISASFCGKNHSSCLRISVPPY